MVLTLTNQLSDRAGRIDLVAEHRPYLDELGNPGPYTKGEISITAANGDVLLGTHTDGVSSGQPPLLEFVDVFPFVDGGTGRFVKASGDLERGTASKHYRSAPLEHRDLRVS